MMIPPILTCVVAIALGVFVTDARSEDIETLSHSDRWQVRYCVPGEFRVATPFARATLERLADDGDRRVARQAFAVYTRLFVDVDSAIVKRAFERGDFDKVGFEGNARDFPGAFRTSDFWREELSSDDNSRAEAVRALGLLKDTTSIKECSRIATRNAYLLAQLAVVFRRLGSDERYLARLAEILELPLEEALYYQTFVVDCLLQTHPGEPMLYGNG